MLHPCSCHAEPDARPTNVLKSEHRVIERVLDALERILAENRIDAAFMHTAIDFLRNFADGCHHAKEEEQLFPLLESLGMPREHGPIGRMLDEHAMGRALIRVMSERTDAAASGDPAAIDTVRRAGRQYIELLRQHIQKEDNVLFFMADRMLDDHHQAQLQRAFNAVEHTEANEGRHEHYLAVAKELCERAFSAAAEKSSGCIS